MLCPKGEMWSGSVWGLSGGRGAERFLVTGGARARGDAVKKKRCISCKALTRWDAKKRAGKVSFLHIHCHVARRNACTHSKCALGIF